MDAGLLWLAVAGMCQPFGCPHLSEHRYVSLSRQVA
jgi:hypothetical protein